MEVLASMNRMSAIIFFSLYFLRNMAPDYSVNTKGPAIEATREFIITYILTFTFIVLFAIPFKTYFVHFLWNLCQLYTFVGIFFNHSVLDILLLDFTGRPVNQASFRRLHPKYRIRNSTSSK